MSKNEIIFGVLDDNEEGLLINEETYKEPFGTEEYFKGIYNQNVDNFVKDFLYSNIEEILSGEKKKPDEIKMELGNLIDVYFVARTEFEKHKTKLKATKIFGNYL